MWFYYEVCCVLCRVFRELIEQFDCKILHKNYSIFNGFMLVLFCSLNNTLKEKMESFWPKNLWVTGGTEIQTGIPSNWRIFESNWLSISSQFDSFSNYLKPRVEISVPPVTQIFRSKVFIFSLSAVQKCCSEGNRCSDNMHEHTKLQIITLKYACDILFIRSMKL